MNNQRGQALLIITFLLAIVLTLGLSSFSSSVSNLQEILIYKDGRQTLFLTESALENGLLRLLRDPGYTGESLQLGNASCIIEVVALPTTMRAECDSGKTVKRLEAQITFVVGQMQVGQISEVE